LSGVLVNGLQDRPEITAEIASAKSGERGTILARTHRHDPCRSGVSRPAFAVTRLLLTLACAALIDAGNCPGQFQTCYFHDKPVPLSNMRSLGRTRVVVYCSNPALSPQRLRSTPAACRLGLPARRSADCAARLDVPPAVVADGADAVSGADPPNRFLFFSSCMSSEQAARRHLSVVVTVRIAAVDDHAGSPEASHIRERHGLVVK